MKIARLGGGGCFLLFGFSDEAEVDKVLKRVLHYFKETLGELVSKSRVCLKS